MSNLLKSDMSFSDEQAMLLDTAVEYCKNASPVARVRDLLISDNGYEAEVWQEVVALGWPGIAIPEDFGGSGLGLESVVPVVEPMGRHLMATPYVSSQIAIQALIAGGSDQHCAAWLPKLAEGATATVALTEHDGNWNLTEIDSKLEGDGLRGNKCLVLDAQSSDLLLISVLHEGEVAVALVPAGDVPATNFSRDIVLDETRRSCSITLDGVKIEPAALITGESAKRALAAAERAAWLLHSADACGGTNATVDLVVEYLNTRTQFGRKIGSYQSLKHPTVDMLTGLERARSHLYHAASLIAADVSHKELDVALRMAKADSADAYCFAGDRAIQFHGGFGFTYECDAQLYLRRALWLQYQFGDAPHHRAALQQVLLD